MGKKELAKSILTEAENARVASLNYLNAKNLSNPIPLQLQLEVAVVQLDIIKNGIIEIDEKKSMLDGIVSTLKERKQILEPLSMISKTLFQTRIISKSMKYENLKDIDDLMKYYNLK